MMALYTLVMVDGALIWTAKSIIVMNGLLNHLHENVMPLLLQFMDRINTSSWSVKTVW